MNMYWCCKKNTENNTKKEIFALLSWLGCSFVCLVNICWEIISFQAIFENLEERISNHSVSGVTEGEGWGREGSKVIL
jgi:hypothetical protein